MPDATAAQLPRFESHRLVPERRSLARVPTVMILVSIALGAPAFGQSAEDPQVLLAQKVLAYCEATMLALGKGVIRCSADPYALADELRKAGKNEEALKAVNEALRRDPNRGAAYALRSGILGNLGQYLEGAADGDLGIKLSKTARDKAMSAYNKCFNLTEVGRKREALGACSLSIQLDGTYSRAHFGAGKLYYYLGMWKEAGRALDKAVTLAPKLAAAWAYRAEVHFKLGEIPSGMVAAVNAVEFGPNDPRSFRARAIGFQLSKRFEEMLLDATRALELQPTRPLAHLLRGQALGLLGRLDEALAEYAAEPDRKAVEPYLNGVQRELYGARVYNCGSTETEIQTPLNFNGKSIEDCWKRGLEALEKTAVPATRPQAPKRSVPGLPVKKVRAN